MKRILLFILFSYVLSFVMKAQEGGVLLSHFRESREIENQSWAICQDGNSVMMFANRRGIMTFDGQSWEFIRMPAVPYALIYSSFDRRVYAGCNNNYGYIQKDEKGFYYYTTLSGDSSNVGLITRIIATDSTVWFYSETTISRHNLKTGLLEKRFQYDGSGLFTGMFITPRNTFINVMSKGLFRVEADTLFPIVTGYLLENEEVLFSLPYDKKMVLLGFGNGSLSLFDGIKFYDYNIGDEGYLRDNILSDGVTISDSLYAFSTIEGGAVVADRKSGKLTATINYQNGLPDDEIYAIAADNRKGLWMSHQYGLSRAALRVPAGNFSIYPGLSGNLTGTLWHNNELYVSTSEGIFYLDEVRNYSEIEVLVRKEKSVSGPGTLESAAAPVQQKQESAKTKKGLLSRIFGKKESSEIKQETLTAGTEQTGIKKAPESQYVKKKINRLKSINYIFRKIEGLNEKCKQIEYTPGGILVSTNSGLYSIYDNKSHLVVKDVYVNYISKKLFSNRYYIATSEGYFYVYWDSGKWNVVWPDRNFTQPLYSITSYGKDVLWAGGNSTAYMISNIQEKTSAGYKNYSVKNDYPNKYIVESTNDTLFLFTEAGIYFYDSARDLFNNYLRGTGPSGGKVNYIFSEAGIPWFNLGDEWIYMPDDHKVTQDETALLKTFDDLISVSISDDYMWVISGNNQLYRIPVNKNLSVKGVLELYVKRVSNEDGIYFNLSDIVFRRGDNTVNIDLVAPMYYKQNSTQYQYYLEKIMSDWSKWSGSSTIFLMPPPGDHIINFRARDMWGNISETKSLRFTIKAPFTQTTAFYVIILTIILLIILIVARFREKQLKKENLLLEEKVRERTKEIQAQKEEITSSIEYASRIQMALLPMEDLYKNNFSDHFILYKPRDIVSGDFYWIGEDGNHIYFTVADCTGHGVPGAFMSTLGISTLNEIITNRRDINAANVLNLLRNKIKTSLHQTGKEGETADGMDIAFCILQKNNKKLEFAGAYNPLLIFHEGVLNEVKGDRMPIGIYYGEKETFTNHEITVSKGDTLYIFSDGICDQFGGPHGVKYKIASLKKLLISIHNKPLIEQKKIIENEFLKWKGSFDQVDDITIVGVRI
jgi:serine phosphatase RsbU (regulator of sigma subunit)